MAVETNYWTRKSPFFEATLRAGCGGFSVANHMYQPHSYADPIEECRHLTEGVTLWFVATERQVEITGPDALAFTELLTPARCLSLSRGTGTLHGDHFSRRRDRQRPGPVSSIR